MSTVSQEFFETIKPHPQSVYIKELNLSIQGADGNDIPYNDCIWAPVEVPFCDTPIWVLVLVVPTTRFNKNVPVIVGTNAISGAQNHCNGQAVLKEWTNAFHSLQKGFAGVVKSTIKREIDILHFETVTLSGFTRKKGNVETAVTEQIEGASDRIGVCPRVVSLQSSSRNRRVPVRIFNISAKTITIKPQTTLCELQEVKVLRNFDPSEQEETDEPVRVASQQSSTEEKERNLPEGVDLETSKLTEEQKEKARELVHKWKHIFSKDITDIGHTDLVKHHIKFTNEEPFKEPFRRIPPNLIQEVREYLKEMMQARAIRESESPFSSNVVIVRRKTELSDSAWIFESSTTELFWMHMLFNVWRIHFIFWLHLNTSRSWISEVGTGRLSWKRTTSVEQRSKWATWAFSSLIACCLDCAMLQQLFSV